MLLKAKQAWSTFTGNHPKFPAFLSAVNSRGVPQGTVITLEFKYPEGDTMKTNLRVTDSDLELLEMARNLLSK